MNTKTISDLASWIATVAAFFFAFIGIFSQPPVIESSRPKLPVQQEKTEKPGQQPSDCRLAQSWDDPLAVFRPGDLPCRNDEQKFTSPTLLLVVLTRMSDYQIDSETRLRNRYAIQSALRDLEYIPETSGELQQVSLQPDAGNKDDRVQVPVETFRRRVVRYDEENQTREKPFCFVRVIWLSERLLSKNSLQEICSTLSANKDELGHGYQQLDLCVLGPTDSDTLARICQKELEPIHPMPLADPVRYPRLLNFQATASTAMIRIFGLQERQPDAFYGLPRQTIISTINEATQTRGGANARLITSDGTQVERVGADDFELCRLLIDEVDRRTRTTGLGERRILVIAEWDSFYGRAAALAFRLAAARVKPDDLLEAAINGRKTKGFEIDSFYYMRGLDGSATLYGKSYPTVPVSTDSRGLTIEPAEGVSQFDYIRRLSDFIGEPVNIFSPTLKEPDAIVLLGTDIYDKLTLLELLRTRFTRSLYLTTDLDALYWHPKYVRFTRNLIVAASFPLEIVDASQMDKEASAEDVRKQWMSGVALDKLITVKNFRKVVFRDSYQTALYYATQHAIARTPIPEWATTPKLFEIGNTKAVRLDSPAWAQLTAPGFWDGYLQGVNAWPSLILQTVLAGVALSFLARLRTLKYEQRCYPTEFYENLKFRLPPEFHPAVDKFEEITVEILVWSSALFPSQLKLNAILRRLTELTALVKSIPTPPEPSHGRVQKQLLKSLDKLTLRFKLNATEQADRFNGTAITQKSLLLRICSLRRLRVKPWWIAEIVTPILHAVDREDEPSNGEIQHFARYASPKGFAKNPIYIGIIIVSIVMLGIYCYFNRDFEGIVGFELRDSMWRWYRVFISLLGMSLIVAVVTWTCSEQWQFRRLVQNLLRGVGECSALLDRQIVSVVAERSNDVSHLSWKPCILIFLFYVAHLRVFVGPPFDLFHWFLFVSLLTPVGIAFVLLSATALAARRRVVSQYQEEILTARRLNTRLASVVKSDSPIQDDLESTASLIIAFAARSSHIASLPHRERIVPDDLRNPTIRQSIRDYLAAVIARNETILSAVAELRSGALSPFAVTSMLGALLVPVGGAGGLTLLEYIVNQVR
jgi:hypothetical protein